MTFVQLPTPGQRRDYINDKRRFRGSIKAEMRRFFAENQTGMPRFLGMEMPLQPETRQVPLADRPLARAIFAARRRGAWFQSESSVFMPRPIAN